ncbi:hypothetical protein W97_04352 [Coniosporium apollinis CBS 100218]|uniref:NADH-ubiquinone oxidoreductase 213 kDa subunit n=1 Tax=Coniosporium apollinis (strain CBS 100218) TaxID=1168221 RepID=R7YTB7_CONA1|nr:uncharacterized protein W97_04352 [Coniosporium apollinis CBS 100218]EON65115.1 hypothetical protein W97_04352 [Coniosporium apollinis CBS 100218]
MASEDHTYHPKDAISATVRTTMITGAAGTIVSGIQNTLTKQNVGAMGVLTRTGGTIAVFAAMGGAYEFAKDAAANLREKDDSWNKAIGGFFGGSMLGLRARTLPSTLGYGAALAVILGAFDYTGGMLSGYTRDPTVDEVSRKEYLRKNRRRPIEQTVAELGEGRGVYAPGYEERRRERIKQNLGIDVSGVPSAH